MSIELATYIIPLLPWRICGGSGVQCGLEVSSHTLNDLQVEDITGRTRGHRSQLSVGSLTLHHHAQFAQIDLELCQLYH